ncbi:MAG TPA: DUF1501 domain-containing protein, partial [Nocardioides sp.]|uniref:DUF1501 domain-containing protein n=1 Tax=Nocardioides sp. TaxID=35761 RepID=UPI002D7F7D6D
DAVHLGSSTPPTIVSGPAASVATQKLEDIKLVGSDSGWAARRRGHLQTMWGAGDSPMAVAARSALSTVATLGAVAGGSYKPAVSYPMAWPASDLSEALIDTARLIKSDIGTEVVSVDYGSWDMHDGYGNLEWGDMQNMTRAFASSVSAFMNDLGSLRSRVTLVTISEFGRRVAENGNQGLDHGWGNMMLLMGGGVAGGRYHGAWPGLGGPQLVDGDLAVTTDYRNVLGELVAKRFPDRSPTSVFPGLVYRPIGVMR